MGLVTIDVQDFVSRNSWPASRNHFFLTYLENQLLKSKLVRSGLRGTNVTQAVSVLSRILVAFTREYHLW